MNLEFHPISEMFPLVKEDQAFFQRLVSDIREHGLAQPVLLYEGKILDGRHRYRACQMAGVEPEYSEFHGTPKEAIEHLWSLNSTKLRRELTSDQRACCDAMRRSLLNSYRALEKSKGETRDA